MTEEALFIELRKNPPAPPWVEFPDMEPCSIGWRMGGGEDHVYRLSVYFDHCSQEERDAYMSRYPEPPGWEGWYSDFDIDGSTLLPTSTGHERVKTVLSSDRSRLAVLTKGPDGLYRVSAFSREYEPGSADTHWQEVGTPSIIDTLELAEQVTRKCLGADE